MYTIQFAADGRADFQEYVEFDRSLLKLVEDWVLKPDLEEDVSREIPESDC